MSALDPNRMTQLVELSALERFAQGAERLQAEEAVSLLLHAAYTDAKEEARADFMARAGKLPVASDASGDIARGTSITNVGASSPCATRGSTRCRQPIATPCPSIAACSTTE
mgnify:CR=1 FL=1